MAPCICLLENLDRNETLDNYCIFADTSRSQCLQNLHCVDLVYAEGKNQTVSLCRLYPRVEDNTIYTEIMEVAQPVIELLVYSKLAHISKVIFFLQIETWSGHFS